MATEARKAGEKLGWLPGAAAVLAFIACNGIFVIVAILSLFGFAVAINPHVQAAAVSVFAVLTVGFVLLGYRDHRAPGPLILAVIGAVLIVGTMYIHFNKIAESIGLAGIIAAAIWSWRAGKARVLERAQG
jgi:arsenite methyltransferase